MIDITFVIDGQQYHVRAEIGDTLLDAAKKNNVPLFGGCDGACICGTCHVEIDNAHNIADEMEAAEEDLLDCLPQKTKNSRLACQVIVSEKINGAIITVVK